MGKYFTFGVLNFLLVIIKLFWLRHHGKKTVKIGFLKAVDHFRVKF